MVGRHSSNSPVHKGWEEHNSPQVGPSSTTLADSWCSFISAVENLLFGPDGRTPDEKTKVYVTGWCLAVVVVVVVVVVVAEGVLGVGVFLVSVGSFGVAFVVVSVASHFGGQPGLNAGLPGPHSEQGAHMNCASQ